MAVPNDSTDHPVARAGDSIWKGNGNGALVSLWRETPRRHRFDRFICSIENLAHNATRHRKCLVRQSTAFWRFASNQESCRLGFNRISGIARPGSAGGLGYNEFT